MAQNIYYVLHVLSLLLLTAVSFQAFADPDPTKRKRSLALSGVLSLLMLTGGFGLLARIYNNTWPTWVVLKVVCWVWLSAVAGLAFRRPALGRPLGAITILVLTAALYLVYFKPSF